MRARFGTMQAAPRSAGEDTLSSPAVPVARGAEAQPCDRAFQAHGRARRDIAVHRRPDAFRAVSPGRDVGSQPAMALPYCVQRYPQHLAPQPRSSKELRRALAVQAVQATSPPPSRQGWFAAGQL